MDPSRWDGATDTLFIALIGADVTHRPANPGRLIYPQRACDC